MRLTNRMGGQSGLLNDLHRHIRMISCDISRLVDAPGYSSSQLPCHSPASQTSKTLHMRWCTKSTELGLFLLSLISCELTEWALVAIRTFLTINGAGSSLIRVSEWAFISDTGSLFLTFFMNIRCLIVRSIFLGINSMALMRVEIHIMLHFKN